MLSLWVIVYLINCVTKVERKIEKEASGSANNASSG